MRRGRTLRSATVSLLALLSIACGGGEDPPRFTPPPGGNGGSPSGGQAAELDASASGNGGASGDASSPADAASGAAGASGRDGAADGAAGAPAPARDAGFEAGHRDGCAPVREDCNGVDDDCDDQIDEGNPGGGSRCTTGLPGACTAGTRTCVAAALVCMPNVLEIDETCNGIDDDCNGEIDDGNPEGGEACVTGLPGVCSAGTLLCAGGALVCTPDVASTPEACNDRDDNCNGEIDEGNPDGGGACPTPALGACATGTEMCQGGALACVQSVVAAPEICNGIDDNCDGTVDDGDPGGGGGCLSGLPGRCGSGVVHCQAGALACEPATGVAETCNGIDDDCNGSTDENDPAGGAACSTGLLGACGPGTITCQSGALRCVATASQGPETCNGVDDDCDGNVDDGDPGTGPCSTGLAGVCAGGTLHCQSGTLACVQDTASSTETCNGLDDDCNGSVDDGVASSGPCLTGLAGVCNAGTVSCQQGVLTCQPNVTASAETCNALDDDCDGAIDEDDPVFGASCVTGFPGVCAAGTFACAGGDTACIPDVTASVEVCNGLDDDCNGAVDDGSGNGCDGACPLTNPPGAPCDFAGPVDLDACDDDVFVCDGAGGTTCVDVDNDVDGDGYSAGGLSCGGDCNDAFAAFSPGAPETCDLVDNDCDGLFDEDCGCEPYTWDGGASTTDWSDPINWAPDGVPGSAPNHCATIPAGFTVTLGGTLPYALRTLDVEGTLTHTAASTAGVTLTVVEDATIGTTGKIDVSGRGFGPISGPGAGANGTVCNCTAGIAGTGAGHGGLGGAGQGGTPAGGVSYGNFVMPTELGSGGGSRACAGSGAAGPGGGRVRLVVSGTLTLDGMIRADGTSATGCANAGGSGGSVWVTAGAVATTGTPLVTASGGNGIADCGCGGMGGGSGAGGRISIDGFTGGLPPALVLEARAGAPAGGGVRGGAGTMFWHGADEPRGHLDTDNGGASGAMTPLPDSSDLVLASFGVGGGASTTITAASGTASVDALTVRPTGILTTSVPFTTTTVTVDGTLTHAAGDADGVTLTATDVTVGPTGTIDVSGRGFGESAGPGAGPNGTVCNCTTGLAGAGAGHGGLGGPGQGGTPAGGGSYGDLLSPVDLGSGGGRRACAQSGTAGLGGGRVRLVVSGELTVDGTIRADGAPGNGCANAGGSGGSIWISAGSVLTNALPFVTANGGNGIADCGCGNIGAGSGAGGRVAIDGFTGGLPAALALEARAGAPAGGAARGGAGTIFWHGADESLGHLDSDNGSTNGSVTPLPDGTDVVLADLGVGAGAHVVLDAPDGIDTMDALTVRPLGILTTSTPLWATTVTVDGTLTHAAGDPDGVTVHATNMQIGAGGSVDVTGRGFGVASGPGAGASGSVCSCTTGLAGAGGGHGGPGGAGQGGSPPGGLVYGSSAGLPVDLGSGGGMRACSASGTSGFGGGLVHLFIDQTLAIDGSILANGSSATGCANAGGAGGSIWITAGALTTSGAPVISAAGSSGIADCGCGGIGGGGGGGGRIAVFADVNALGPLAVAGAGSAAGGASAGAPGLVHEFPGVPSFIALVSPPLDGTASAGGTLLEWSTLGTADHFHVELDDDAHVDASANHPEVGAAPIAAVTETGGADGGPLTATTWTTPALASGTTYYWHVVAHDASHALVGGSRLYRFSTP